MKVTVAFHIRISVLLSFVNPRKGGSSRSQVFFKRGVLKSFANFTGKQMCWSLVFNKVSGLKTFLSFPDHVFLQNTSGGCFWTGSVKEIAALPF